MMMIIIIIITTRSARCDDHQQPECFCLHYKQRKFLKVCVSDVINNEHEAANNNMQIRGVLSSKNKRWRERTLRTRLEYFGTTACIHLPMCSYF